ncbi:hypothetical protein ABZY31_12935 [Streptomyces sp. NPDC006529]|uniref:preATP grasp domain-containing protein n=1 Tax=Streptomyces sp. NPDC006529 TaxID=3157177 RepID=UPI0033A666BD
MVDRLEDLDPREREGTPVVAARMVWLLRDGDALVLPQPVDPSFVAHVGALMGFDPARVDLLTPGDSDVRVLGQEALLRPKFLDRLRKVVAVPEDWAIRAYMSDRGIAPWRRRSLCPRTRSPRSMPPVARSCSTARSSSALWRPASMSPSRTGRCAPTAVIWSAHLTGLPRRPVR